MNGGKLAVVRIASSDTSRMNGGKLAVLRIASSEMNEV